LVFCDELPQASSVNRQEESSHTTKTRSQFQHTRANIYYPNHSPVASKFSLVPGFLSEEDKIRFHRPSFPRGHFTLNVRKLVYI
jgi:hypothetical protein